MPPSIQQNTLFYGDNLAILRDHISDQSVDLIYLDPPFNSSRSYNVLFADESGRASEAQLTAFDDTWHWGPVAEAEFYDLTIHASIAISKMIGALRDLIGTNQMTAYLVMMTARLVQLHRVLKPTGSLYLHCDPTASHYLKVILDTIFGVENFRNEIIWRRTLSKSLMTRRLPSNHDILHVYQKTDQATWNGETIFIPYDLSNLDEKTKGKYYHRDSDGRLYRLDNLINPNPDRPNLTYEFLGHKKVWRWTKDRMQAAYEAGLVIQPSLDAVPSYKRYLDEQRGKPLGDVWIDIPPINSQAAERLGYPTQKPLALLERIIQASSNPGEVVLDPFCGCGTAIAAAEKLNRRWIGIDITHLAISLIKYRMRDMFPNCVFDVIGEPQDLEAARQLAKDNRYQFQWWALSLVDAKPVGGDSESKKGKKGKDLGIDGVINIFDDPKGKPLSVIVQVKSGKVGSHDIRDLHGVLDRESAPVAILITLEPPTKDMITEAVSAGYYNSPIWQREFPRLQILTIEDLLNGYQPDLPPSHGTFKKAPRARKSEATQKKLDL